MLAEWNRTNVFAFQNISCVTQSAVISISHTEAFRWLAYPAKVGLACITIDTDVDSITHGQRFSSHHRYVLFFTFLSLINTGTWYWCYIHAFTPSNHGLHSETPIIVFSCLEHLKGSPVRPITGTYEEYIVSTSVTIRSCTIFLRNQPSAPQKVDVRLATHPFSPPAPFLAVRPPKCADPIRRRPQERMGSVFAAGEKKLRAFLMIVSTILRWISLWLSFSRELSSNVWRFSLSEDETRLPRLAKMEETMVSMIQMVVLSTI